MSVLSMTDYPIVRHEAEAAAARLGRRYQLPLQDRADLRHDFLVDFLARHKAFDQGRGSLGAFAGTVMTHEAKRLGRRIRRQRALFAQVALDDLPSAATGRSSGAEEIALLSSQKAHPFDIVDRRLDICRAFSCLPATDIALCAKLAEHTVTELGRVGPIGRSSLYRQIRRIRLRLLAAGIDPTL